MRCFDSSIDAIETRRFTFARHVRICSFCALLAPDRIIDSVFDPAGDRRCEQ